MAGEEARGGESAGSPGVRWAPGDGVLTAALAEAARGPATRRREIGGRELQLCTGKQRPAGARRQE